MVFPTGLHNCRCLPSFAAMSAAPTTPSAGRLQACCHFAKAFLIALIVAAIAPAARAQTVPSAAPPGSEPHTLEPVTVFGRHTSLHDVASESDLVGPANQPEWTTRRAFAETDIYVIPPGEIEFNQFYILSHPRHGKAENLFESEFEFGLPWRTQFDVELSYRVEDGDLRYDSTFLELPHALADWGKIPFNPAINAGWRFNSDEADAYIIRLLLAEEFAKRVHFGANLSFEQQVGGERETEYELNAAPTFVAVDQKLTLGAELVAEYEVVDEEEELTVLLGPTLLYKPTRNTHLGLVPLFGLTGDDPLVEAFFIFGIDLEPLLWNANETGSVQPDSKPLRRLR
jgi:hypothetical protein